MTEDSIYTTFVTVLAHLSQSQTQRNIIDMCSVGRAFIVTRCQRPIRGAPVTSTTHNGRCAFCCWQTTLISGVDDTRGRWTCAIDRSRCDIRRSLVRASIHRPRNNR